MTGSGVGATYDQKRDVLWILDQAKINVTPAKDGHGGLEGRRQRRPASRGRALHSAPRRGADRRAKGGSSEANDVMIRLTDDDERVQLLELRGNSRITGGTGGPAVDVGARHRPHLRPKTAARCSMRELVENAVLQLPGSGAGAAGKRIAGNTIDIGLGARRHDHDELTANGRVQVDLPAEGRRPGQDDPVGDADGGRRRRRRPAERAPSAAASSTAKRAPAGATSPASERTATSQTLIIETKPGLGAIQKADFRGNVTVHRRRRISWPKRSRASTTSRATAWI